MRECTEDLIRESIVEVTLHKYKLKQNCLNINTYLPEDAYDKGVNDGIQFIIETINDKLTK